MSSMQRSTAASGTKAPGAVLNTVYWDSQEQWRWWLLEFMGLVFLYASRYFFAICIVPMADEMGWDKRDCGIMLSSFYWGYILTQIIGGNLSDRFGGDLIQWTAAVVWSLATLSVVYVTHISMWLIIAVRCVAGLAQGVHYPALISLIGHKVPEQSRTKFYGTATTGSFLGIMCTGLFGTLIVQSYGWRLLVILVGCGSLAWAVGFRLFSASHRKKTHYKLSDSILSSAAASRLKLHVQPSTFIGSCGNVPWREMLSQAPVIALLCAHLSESAYIHIIPSWAPTYFSEVFPNRSSSAWFYNTAPSLFMAAGSYTGALLANHLIVQEYDVTAVRKMSVCISLLGPGICLIIISLFGRDGKSFPLTLLLFLAASYTISYHVGGASVNTMDLAPNHSGSLHGVANTCGALPGVFAVSLVGYILHATGSWSLVFCLVSVVVMSGALVFLVYGSARRLQLSTTPHK